jgi:hypothetical protein
MSVRHAPELPSLTQPHYTLCPLAEQRLAQNASLAAHASIWVQAEE